MKSIGEDLGELMEWRLTDPYPKVRVMVACDSPLIFHRETVSDTGNLIRIRFDYVKLQGYCKRGLRMTHDSTHYPDRVVVPEKRHHPYRKQNEDMDGGKRPAPRKELAGTDRPREGQGRHVVGKNMDMGSTSKQRPVRRDLLEELGEAREPTRDHRIAEALATTKEWVRKRFGKGEVRGEDGENRVKRSFVELDVENKAEEGRAPWYRRSVEDAYVVNQTNAQIDVWDQKEGRRRSEPVNQERATASPPKVAHRKSVVAGALEEEMRQTVVAAMV